MRPFLVSIGILSWLGTAAVLVAYQPPFEPDREGYEQCRKLYPQGYCKHTYLDPR
jgi:hypothetical protein